MIPGKAVPQPGDEQAGTAFAAAIDPEDEEE